MSDEDKTALVEALDDGLKTVTSAAISSFPVVGGPISFLLNRLWSQDDESRKQRTMHDMEQRLKDYVDQKVDALALADVRATVHGYLDLLAKFDRDTDSDKYDTFKALIASGVTDLPQIFKRDESGNPDNPEKFYTYYLLFASAHLIVLNHQLFNFKECRGLDPTDREIDTHYQDLVHYHNEHVRNVGYMKQRLLDWRMNNISDSVGEKTVMYDRGPELGMDSYVIFEWHDTIDPTKNWSGSDPLNGDREQAIKAEGEALLSAYRAGMRDESEKTFENNGKTVESFAYSLARDLAVVPRWKMLCNEEAGLLLVIQHHQRDQQ